MNNNSNRSAIIQQLENAKSEVLRHEHEIRILKSKMKKLKRQWTESGSSLCLPWTKYRQLAIQNVGLWKSTNFKGNGPMRYVCGCENQCWYSVDWPEGIVVYSLIGFENNFRLCDHCFKPEFRAKILPEAPPGDNDVVLYLDAYSDDMLVLLQNCHK